MKIYTGIDIVENNRIEKAYKKFGERFLKKIYTDREIQYCFKKKDFIPCLSARFAAKEATIKAYYQAFNKSINYKSIEIIGINGKPAEIILHNDTNHKKNFDVSISISHEKKYSVAVVIIYTA
ncbi:holo-ACP synthase [Sulfurihydrogenibium sp.]|uniref:holo-ACP synthase n=1 Tax=Sulfurihydrogenibium sp. TaxID=2053621 RepID=UPI0026198530|nr:holo-ACP synthase [Sulfurihydrogenibium sp.]